jgi:two-component system heavy metal sensor histidine kinase CusS
MTEPAPRPRAPALTVRLVAGYSLAALVTLTVAAWFLYRGLKQSFLTEDAELLSGHVARLRKDVLKRPLDLHEAEELITASVDPSQMEKYYGTLLDPSGRVLLRSPAADTFNPPPEAFPAPAAAGEKLAAVKQWRSPAGILCFLGAAEISRGRGQTPLLYRVVLPAGHVEEWMNRFARKLVFAVGLGTLASSLLAWFITRRGLTPLRDITAAAQRVTVRGLDERIGEKAWPQELASLAAEFDRMLGRLRGSFERLSQFTADAAHEFRTPLNNLLGGTSLALSRPRSDDEYRALLETNLEEYQRLSQMVDSLLFLARADNAQTVVKSRPLDAVAALNEVADFFSALAEEAGISLTCEGNGTVTADPGLLRMALTNLVSNALRHSPPGGAVRMRAEEQNGVGLTISVADEGPGIAPEHLPRVFERFYRVDESRATGGGMGGNSGLGLALVKTIMELHGGSVTVESTPGRGATFRLVFPAAPEA